VQLLSEATTCAVEILFGLRVLVVNVSFDIFFHTAANALHLCAKKSVSSSNLGMSIGLIVPSHSLTVVTSNFVQIKCIIRSSQCSMGLPNPFRARWVYLIPLELEDDVERHPLVSSMLRDYPLVPLGDHAML